jgi:hypothetical protein
VKFLHTAHRAHGAAHLSVLSLNLVNDNTNDSHYTYLEEGSKQFREML